MFITILAIYEPMDNGKTPYSTTGSNLLGNTNSDLPHLPVLERQLFRDLLSLAQSTSSPQTAFQSMFNDATFMKTYKSIPAGDPELTRFAIYEPTDNNETPYSTTDRLGSDLIAFPSNFDFVSSEMGSEPCLDSETKSAENSEHIDTANGIQKQCSSPETPNESSTLQPLSNHGPETPEEFSSLLRSSSQSPEISEEVAAGRSNRDAPKKKKKKKAKTKTKTCETPEMTDSESQSSRHSSPESPRMGFSPEPSNLTSETPQSFDLTLGIGSDREAFTHTLYFSRHPYYATKQRLASMSDYEHNLLEFLTNSMKGQPTHNPGTPDPNATGIPQKFPVAIPTACQKLLGNTHINFGLFMAEHSRLPLSTASFSRMGLQPRRLFIVEDVNLREPSKPRFIEEPLSIFLELDRQLPAYKPCGRLLRLPPTPTEMPLPFPFGFENLDSGQVAEAHCRGLLSYGPDIIPNDDRWWFSIATANTRCPVCFSPMATALIIEHGSRLLWVAQPSTTHSMHGINAFRGIESDSATFICRFAWQAFILPPRTVFVLRPNTPWMTYAIQTSLMRGLGFFSVSTIIDSVCGLYHKAFTAPLEMITALPRLARLFSFWFENLKEIDKGNPPDIFVLNHLPDPRTWRDLVGIISLGNALLLSSALDFRTYDTNDTDLHYSPEDLSERRAVTAHVLEFRTWFLERYQVINPTITLNIFDESLLDVVTLLTFRHEPVDFDKTYIDLDSFSTEVQHILQAYQEATAQSESALEPICYRYKCKVARDPPFDSDLFIPLINSSFIVSRLDSNPTKRKQ
ncbi:hypothetical protein B0H10DRAFT_1415208 [Mycena sp. CBHHK59/15]|nr:hypothetical protein B0H10DRAFT_1415208 [Mycena sp. CBHHK59/15]